MWRNRASHHTNEVPVSIIPPPPTETADAHATPRVSFDSITADTQVTKFNIDKCEAYLKTQGLTPGKQPDELHPYYEMFMQIVAVRERQSNQGGAGQSRAAIIDGKPGPLMSQPVIEFHSVNGMDMYKGRRAENGKSFIPGFFACAGALSKAVSLSNRGNPWADLQLLMAYAYLRKFEEDLIERMKHLDDLRIARMQLVHRDLSWVIPRPEEIARPNDPIFVSTQYANLLLDVLILTDRCTIRYRHAQLNNLIPAKEAVYAEIQSMMRKWRSLVYFIWSGTRLFLERETIIGATRADSSNAAPTDLEAFAIQHFRLKSNAMPQPIWDGSKLPPHLGR